jgi:hypothetical protein
MANTTDAKYIINNEILGGLDIGGTNGEFVSIAGGTASTGSADSVLHGSIYNDNLLTALNSIYAKAEGNNPGGPQYAVQFQDPEGAFNGEAALVYTTPNLVGTGGMYAARLRSSALGSGQIPFAGAAGELSSSANLGWDGSQVGIAGGLAASTHVRAAQVRSSALTDTQLVFAGAAGELSSSTAMTFDGNDVTFTGNLDAADINGTNVVASAMLSGQLVRSGDLTATHVVFAGAAGELSGAANMTFDGSDLTVPSLLVSDLTSGRVALVGGSGAVEDSANLTFGGGELVSSGGMYTARLRSSNLSSGQVTFAGAAGELSSSAGLAYDGTDLAVGGDVNAVELSGSGRVSAGTEGFRLEGTNSGGSSQVYDITVVGGVLLVSEAP